MAVASYEGAPEQDGASGRRERPAEPAAEDPKFVVGPGFEIAVRSGEGRAFDLTVDGGRKGPQRPRRTGAQHEHPDIERRIELVEESLIDLVDQMEAVERKIEALIQAANGPGKGASK